MIHSVYLDDDHALPCEYADEVRALEAEVERLKHERDIVLREHDKAFAEVTRLRKALGRATVYVEHLPTCCAQKVPTTCNCGYCEMVVMAEAALAGEVSDGK